MTDEPTSPGPILVAHLLPEIEAHLLELLRALRPEEWRLPTLAPAWTVKDVAAHLLDTQLRRLALCRDGHVPPGAPPASAAEVAALVNRLNAEGVAYYARLSPPVLIALMEVASRESAAYLQSLDPAAPAAFGVSWAGEDTSANWFDVARELTERWHHQQQIREATGRPGILTPRLYGPVLDCFMRGLPHAYRAVDAAPGDTVRFDVVGDCGGSWWLYRAALRLAAQPRPSTDASWPAPRSRRRSPGASSRRASAGRMPARSSRSKATRPWARTCWR